MQKLRLALGRSALAVARRTGLLTGFRKRTTFARFVLIPIAGRVHPAEGFMVEVDPHDSLGIASLGGYEDDLISFVRATLGEGDVFVDVGANMGWHSLIASRLVGESGRVLAFEPEAENFARLAANVARNRCFNVIPVRSAAGPAPGSARLTLDDENFGSHAIGETGQPIPVNTLDALLNAWDVEPALVKLDIEGFELEALRGLSSTPPVLLEYRPDPELRALLEERYREILEVRPAPGGHELVAVDHEELTRRLIDGRYTHLFAR